MGKKCGINHNVVCLHDNIVAQQLVPMQGCKDSHAINQTVAKSQLRLEKCDKVNHKLAKTELKSQTVLKQKTKNLLNFHFWMMKAFNQTLSN